MLRRLSNTINLSSLAGGAVFCGLYVANWLTVEDDSALRRYRELPKPLAVPHVDASLGTSSLGPHSDVYKGISLPPPKGSIAMPHPHNTTLISTLEESCRRFGDRPAMGVRSYQRLEKQTRMIDGRPKVWDVHHFGPTRYYTYAELWEHIVAFGRGLMELGLAPDARVALCEDTRMEWFVGCYGVWYAGATGCTVYANMNADALEYALAQMGPTHVLCNGNNLGAFISYFSREDHSGPVPVFIYTDSLPNDFVHPPGFIICSYADTLAKGRASTEMPKDPHTADEVALIMYTSGTTGKPKGVMVTHDNILHTIEAIGSAMDHLFGDRSDVTYLAYLPLAHILEFVCENTLLHRGMLIAYGNPRTLTDASAYPHGDLKEFRPQFMCGVPRVFDSIRKTVYGKLSDRKVAKFVFDAVYNDKVRWMRRGKDTPLYNKLIFNKVRETLGGRIEALLSGGAPLSPKSQQFMQTTVTSSMIQGYGLTETCACTTIQYPGDRTKQCVGILLPGVEVLLRDTGGWKHTDGPEPRGELLIRGKTVTKGYFKYPKKTAESFLEGGWFATGDIASITSDGSLRIVGRVESLVKNANGEYIAVEALEAVYSLHPLVNPNSACVVVDQEKSYICAIALTDMNKTMSFASSHGISGTWPNILHDPLFKKAVVTSFQKAGRRARLRPFELVADVALLFDEWTPENGCLTAAMKMKRNIILERHADVVKDLFKQ